MRTLRVVINRQIGSAVFPSAFAAYILLGGRDAYCSFETVPLSTYRHVEEVKKSATESSAGGETYEAVVTDNGVAWTSQHDDYR